MIDMVVKGLRSEMESPIKLRIHGPFQHMQLSKRGRNGSHKALASKRERAKVIINEKGRVRHRKVFTHCTFVQPPKVQDIVGSELQRFDKAQS